MFMIAFRKLASLERDSSSMRLLELHFSSKNQSLEELLLLGELLGVGQVLMGQGLGPLGAVEDGVARKVGDGGLRKLVEVVGVAGEAVQTEVVPAIEAVVPAVEDVGVVLVVVQVGVEVVVLGGGGHVVILLGLLVVGDRDRRGDGLLPGGVVGLHVVVEPAGVRGLRVDLDLAETGEGRERLLGLGPKELSIGIGLGLGVGGHRDGENHNL